MAVSPEQNASQFHVAHCFMQDGALPGFDLPVYAWQGCEAPTTQLLKSCIKFSVISFCGVGPYRKSTNQNHKHRTNWYNRLEIIFLVFLLNSEGKMVSLGLPGCRGARKLSKSCRNTAFKLGDKVM
jgi:hypothetical protein